MIRFPVFAVLGPFTGYFVFIGLGGGIKGDSAGITFGMLLPVAWIAGLVPASITAALDQLFERLGARSVQRYLLTAIVGYASAYLFMKRTPSRPVGMSQKCQLRRKLFRDRADVSTSIRLGSRRCHPRCHLLIRDRKVEVPV
jgi:hypothetical protein